MMAVSLAELIDALTKEGVLYEKLPSGDLRCYACGHRCLIHEGKRGICKVRFNQGGTLYVPTNYVAALQCDPTEKKPFFHVLPGSSTLTFGMLGCDYHCAYCFSGITRIATTQGPLRIDTLFEQAKQVIKQQDGEIAFSENLEVYTHVGRIRRVRAIFCHSYEGPMLTLRPAFLPPLECTPDHKLLALPRPKHGKPPGKPRWIRAHELTKNHCLAIPKQHAFSRDTVLDVPSLIFPLVESSRMQRELTGELMTKIAEFTEQGLSRTKIAAIFGRSHTSIANLQMKLKKGIWNPEDLQHYDSKVLIEGGYARLFNEHAPGIPRLLPLDPSLAALLGYYCAEGCVWKDTKRRANSVMLTFSFGRHEIGLAEKVQRLLKQVFGVQATIHKRRTTQAVVTYKASLGLLFKALCGSGARDKCVPQAIFEAPREVAETFLTAYVEGDGSRSDDEFVQTATVSEELAHGIAWLALKLGRVPSLRSYGSAKNPIEGRVVQRSSYNYHVRWWEDRKKRRLWEDDEYYYIPLRSIAQRSYRGDVYNMEVEEDHSYLANYAAVGNCQNYLTSQALRDPAAGVQPMTITAERMVDLAKRYGAKLVGSSYNEPLITAEWAVEVFKLARKQGFKTCFISNGNATKEVLQYLRPWCDAYKVDLKSMSDRNYRKLGGLLSNVLETIQRLVEMGFWVEIVTLIVPGFNDADDELRQAAKFLASLSPDIPWHVTAFHKDYKMTDPDNTPPSTLLRAAEIGREAGLRYVYTGNLPGRVGPYENTYCPTCQSLLIERFGFEILQYRLTNSGRCPSCSTQIPGVWWD